MHPRINKDYMVKEVKEYVNGSEHSHLITLNTNNQLVVSDDETPVVQLY